MKNTFIVTLAVLMVSLPFLSCKKSAPEEGKIDGNVSYALGMTMGEDLKGYFNTESVAPDIDEFIKGFRDALTGGKTRFDTIQASEMINSFFSSLTEEKKAEATRKENEFLAENSRKPGVKITASGLQYEVIKEGTGPKPSASNVVKVHYEGSLTDGAVFDSSYENGGAPVEIPLGYVIPGWTEGLQLMSVGSTYKLYIPSALGYGSSGGGGMIPPYSTLIFVIELLDILEEQENVSWY